MTDADPRVGPGDGPGAVATIDGVDFAVGLVWFEEDPAMSMLERARGEAAKELVPSDMGVFLKGPPYQVYQFGLGWAAHGHYRGCLSLAAAIAAGEAPTWLVAWPLDDGRWWVGSCHEGRIDRLGDRLFDRESAARACFDAALSSPSPGRDVFAPRHWAVPGAFAAEPRRLLAAAVSSPRLRQLSGLLSHLPAFGRAAKRYDAPEGDATAPRPARGEVSNGMAALIILGFCAVLGGIAWWRVSKPPAAADAKPLNEIWAAPWNGAPRADQALGLCEDLALAQDLPVVGWRTEGSDCLIAERTATSTLHWRRRQGFTRDLSSGLAEAGLPAPLFGDGNTALSRLTRDGLAPRPPEGLWREADLRRELTDRLMASGATALPSKATAAADRPGPGSLTHQPGHFTVQVSDPRRTVRPDLLAGMPGLVLTERHETAAGNRSFVLTCYFRSDP